MIDRFVTLNKVKQQMLHFKDDFVGRLSWPLTKRDIEINQFQFKVLGIDRIKFQRVCYNPK